MISLWVLLAIGSAAAQTTRGLMQRTLMRGQGGPALHRDVVNAVRVWMGLPFAGLMLAVALTVTAARPVLDPWVISMIALGSVAHLVANDLVLRLFTRRHFGLGIAYQKSENLLMAVAGPVAGALGFGLALTREPLGVLDWLGIVLATCGLVLMSLMKLDRDQRQFDGASMGLGLGCGLAFAITGITYGEAVRGMSMDLSTWQNAALAGMVVLMIALLIQSTVMGLWTRAQGPIAWTTLRPWWKELIIIGALACLGSGLLYVAFGFAHPALVTTVKQVDIPLSLALAFFLFRERPQWSEWIGTAMIFASVILIALF